MAGRPTDYKPEYNKQVYKLCLLSATDKELADFFEVSEVTINAWKKKHPAFLKSLKKGKVQADAEVAAKLFHRATGYEHPEDKIFCTDGRVTTVKTIKHYPPDTAAAFIWLKNRAGWRDKQEYEHSGSVDVNQPPTDPEERLRWLQEQTELIKAAKAAGTAIAEG